MSSLIGGRGGGPAFVVGSFQTQTLTDWGKAREPSAKGP